jgi:hypothetical protein
VRTSVKITGTELTQTAEVTSLRSRPGAENVSTDTAIAVVFHSFVRSQIGSLSLRRGRHLCLILV